MTNAYEKYLEKAKALNYPEGKYKRLEEIMEIAKKAEFPLANPLEITNQFEFSLSLTPVVALYESHQINGDEGYIVYLKEKNFHITHFWRGKMKRARNLF